jgi:hypothetical protein
MRKFVSGDLMDPEYVKNHKDAGFASSELFSGGYGVLEWIELERQITPAVISDVAQQLARLHLASEGMSTEYGTWTHTHTHNHTHSLSHAHAHVRTYVITNGGLIRT